MLRYGICVTQTCKKIYDREKGDLRLTLEACLNESMSKKHNLKVKLLDVNNCSDPTKTERDIDGLDMAVAAICLVLLVLNAIGSICDYYSNEKQKNGKGLRFILCFSLFRNWKKLTAPAGEGPEPRLERLKGIHGLRAITMSLVIMAHSIFISIVFIDNPEFLEQVYQNKIISILINGTLIMQTFLMISAFLLVYNWLLHSEKHAPSWTMLPQRVILRWLRLTPPYALILGLTATWFTRIASGPLWTRYMAQEMYDCRKHWWMNLLYINNYFEGSECMIQSWYLATDTQLYSLGVIVYLLCKTSRSRKIALSFLFIAGMVIPAAHVYFQDLDGILLISPETIMNLFITDPHFNNVYIRGHTNIIGYAVGMSMGYLLYHWQTSEIDLKKYQTIPYRLVYRFTFIIGCLCCGVGNIFYFGPRLSIFIRTLFAAFLKPIFAVSIGSLIVGLCLKFEDFYRGILEAKFWAPMGRLTYSAYLVHISLVRLQAVIRTTVVGTGYIYMAQISVFTLIASFLVGGVFWHLMEAPVGNLIQEYFFKRVSEKKSDKQENLSSAAKKELKN